MIWETIKRTLMCPNSKDQLWKQSSRHSWPAVKKTNLGNNQTDPDGHWSRGYLWEWATVKETPDILGKQSNIHSSPGVNGTFLGKKQASNHVH